MSADDEDMASCSRSRTLYGSVSRAHIDAMTDQHPPIAVAGRAREFPPGLILRKRAAKMATEKHLGFQDVIELVAARRGSPCLVAIDGLPLSGKSTLATEIEGALGIPPVGIDGFFLPRDLWPPHIGPALPFPFFRMEAFFSFVRELADTGRASYFPYDWEHRRITTAATSVDMASGPLVIEGCSVLAPETANLFALSFFVDSDGGSILRARRARDGSVDEDDWTRLFLPSVECYMRTSPADRAMHIVAGRGALR